MAKVSTLSAALVAALGLAAATPEGWADSPVVIEGANEDVRRAVLELLPDREAPTTLFEAERIAEEAAARATAWLRSEGYYAAQVTPEAQEAPAVSARLVISPGPRFHFAAPSAVYDGAAPNDDAQAAVTDALSLIGEGAPARAQDVIDAQATALARLQGLGYVDAQVRQRRVVADHATQQLSAEFEVSAGARARLGRLVIEPPELLRPGTSEHLRNWTPGDAYSPDALSRLRRDTTSTGAYAVATTRLAPPDQDGVRDVVLTLEPAHRNAYEVGVGYSTTEGLGVEAEWTRRNVTRRADSLVASTVLGETRQNLKLELIRPHAAGLGHAITYGALAERETPQAYTREGIALYASVDAGRRLNFGRGYGLRLSADHYADLAGGVTDAYVLSGFFSLRRDTTEFTLDPRDGSILEFRLEPSVSAGDKSLAFTRATAEARVYDSFGLDDRLTLAARARAGWLEPLSGSADDVPADRRFYAGGGGSVRGYDYNSIYPRERDLLGLAPGGQGLLEGSVEARWRFGDHWGAAAFVDGGNAFDTWGDVADFTWGAGVGVRYDLGFAPLRIDVATPLDRDRPGSADYALYISVGQAF